MDNTISRLERERLRYAPRLPGILAAGLAPLETHEGPATSALRDAAAIRDRFPETFGRPILHFRSGAATRESRPLKLGVVLSGGQAPGGHNVITGLYDGAVALHPDSQLFGFLGGPKGIFTERYVELTAASIAAFRNTGGFDMIGSGRDKIETAEQLAACQTVAKKLGLDGLAVVGGDDSNTNAAVLAEYFLQHGSTVAVVGVPKTIDGDLKSDLVEASFGFDTATKVYSELIGNICRDARSAGKYWHFIKLMGRSASHVTLECALATRANVALVGEEIQEAGMTLAQVVDGVVDVVRRRAASGIHHGVCLVAEGLIEFVPEMRVLIDELNAIVSEHADAMAQLEIFAEKRALVAEHLSATSAAVFAELMPQIQEQLLLDRDSHGNVQVSKIDTERLLMELAARRLAALSESGDYAGKFQVQHHFLGYEGRCAAPSNFDADYTYGLGHVAALLASFGKTGYMSTIGKLDRPSSEWEARGVPLTSMMQMEVRKGQPAPVIGKALVDTQGAPFRAFAAARKSWQDQDHYVYPGPLQYFGPPEICDATTVTLGLESKAAKEAKPR